MSIREAGEVFMKYGYAETKDLCKQFLTLASSILVFSLAFSEKIVNYGQSSAEANTFLFTSWVLLLFSIIACGVGLCYLALAGGQAVYGTGNTYLYFADTSYGWVLAAGGSFVVGLLAMVVAGIISSLKRPLTAPAQGMPFSDLRFCRVLRRLCFFRA